MDMILGIRMFAILQYVQFAILILIGRLRCFNEAKLVDMILGIRIFQIGFLNFSNICCWYTLELSHKGNSNVHLQHNVKSINECFLP